MGRMSQMVGRLSVMPIFGGGKEDQSKTREKVCFFPPVLDFYEIRNSMKKKISQNEL